MDKETREYLDPMINRIHDNIRSLLYRLNSRSIDEWHRGDFDLAASTTREIARDCEFVKDAIDIIRDVRNGELDAEDRERREA